jgi:hypothetical protein
MRWYFSLGECIVTDRWHLTPRGGWRAAIPISP